MSILEKIKTALSDMFNLNSEFPEPPVLKEMENAGWRFHVESVVYPYGAAAIHSIYTPEGLPVDLYHSSESRRRYDEVVAETQAKLGLTPK